MYVPDCPSLSASQHIFTCRPYLMLFTSKLEMVSPLSVLITEILWPKAIVSLLSLIFLNVSQLPFWALSIFLTWRCLKRDKIIDYIFLGIVLGLGILSKYLFIYLPYELNTTVQIATPKIFIRANGRKTFQHTFIN